MKYKITDLNRYIKSVLIFVLLFLIIIGMGVVVAELTLALLGDKAIVNSNIFMGFGVIFAMLVYYPIKRGVTYGVENTVFREDFNHKKFLQKAGQAISKVRSLSEVSNLLVLILCLWARIKSAQIYVRDEKSGELTLEASRGVVGGVLKCNVLEYINKYQTYISYRNLLQINYNAEVADIEKFMKENEIMLIIPSFKTSRGQAEGSKLRGVFFLGEKKSGKRYQAEEIKVFSILAQQSEIAIENARLYDQAVNKREEIENSNKELESKNRMLQDMQTELILAEKRGVLDGMAKAMGHEINNPLAWLLARSNTLSEEAVLELESYYKESLMTDSDLEEQNVVLDNLKKIKDKAERIYRSGKRIEVAVRTLTNLEEGESGEIGPLNFRILWKECLEAKRFLTFDTEDALNLNVEEHIEPNLVVNGNIEQLIQVFTNMIKNSIEAMKPYRKKKIIIYARKNPKNEGEAEIEFSDIGPGIKREIEEDIWVQGFTTKGYVIADVNLSGQGQGLFICKHIIEDIHGGKIEIKKENKPGVTFRISLPLGDSDGK